MKKSHLRFSGLLVFLTLVASLAVMSLSAAEKAEKTLSYLKMGEPAAIELLAPPPLPDSDEQKYDLAEVAAVQHASSSNELAEATVEDKGVSVYYFTPVIGGALQAGKLPVTEKFLKRVQTDADIVVTTAKNYWQRPRPSVVDPTLLMGKATKSFSYPSGHSTESMTLALVLSELYPDKRDALVAEARHIGWHRVELARHYPTDVFAGRVLAQEIVRDLDKNPNFEKDLAAAKTEIANAQK